MKKSLVALAVLSTVGAGAFAQSSVTLFGVADVNARYSDNGSAKLYSLSQDGIASSRLGVRGVEDLGGGMRASFWFEGAMNPDTGTPGGQTWQRRSTVSLTSGFGEVRVGRDYTPTFWNLTMFDPFGTNGVGAYSNIHASNGAAGQTANLIGPVASTATASNPAGNLQTLVRANNSIGYFLPGNLGGIYGQAMVAANEASPVNGNKYFGARVGYMAGPLNVAASYGQTTVQPVAGDDSVQNFNVAGSYKLGNLTAMAQYGRFSLASTDFTNYLIGGTFGMGALTFKASYSSFENSSTAADATQIAAGVQYDLSRRTALYTNVARITNDGTATTGANFGTGTLNAVRGKNHTGLEVGVRHSF